jgi:peroxiredoxin
MSEQAGRSVDRTRLPNTTTGSRPSRGVFDNRLHRLQEFIGDRVTIVGFADENSLQNMEFLTWIELANNIDTVVVSNSQYSTLRRSKVARELPVPVLADPQERIAKRYQFASEEFERCQVLLIDSSHRIRQTWSDRPDPKQIYATAQGFLETENPDKRRDNK